MRERDDAQYEERQEDSPPSGDVRAATAGAVRAIELHADVRGRTARRESRQRRTGRRETNDRGGGGALSRRDDADDARAQAGAGGNRGVGASEQQRDSAAHEHREGSGYPTARAEDTVYARRMPRSQCALEKLLCGERRCKGSRREQPQPSQRPAGADRPSPGDLLQQMGAGDENEEPDERSDDAEVAVAVRLDRVIRVTVERQPVAQLVNHEHPHRQQRGGTETERALPQGAQSTNPVRDRALTARPRTTAPSGPRRASILSVYQWGRLMMLRTTTCLLMLLAALALPATALAHPGDHGPQAQQGAPPPPVVEEPQGGSSPLVIGGVVVGLLGLLGVLMAVNQRQRRPASSVRASSHERALPREPAPSFRAEPQA